MFLADFRITGRINVHSRSSCVFGIDADLELSDGISGNGYIDVVCEVQLRYLLMCCA